MKHKNSDIFAATFLATLSLALVFFHIAPGSPLLAVFGFLLVFILPGFALSAALFPESSRSILEKILLTLGLSLVISILGGILLYYLSIPLRGESWAIYFGLVIFISGIIVLIRRSRLPKVPAKRRGSDTIPVVYKLIYPAPKQLILFGISALIMIGAIMLAQKVAATQPATEIVQLWILPDDSNSAPSVDIGILTNEFAPHEFSLWLEKDGYTIQRWPQLVVKSGEKWLVTVPIDSNLSGTGPLEAYLYLYDQPDLPYRHVILWPDQLIKK